MGRQKGKKWFYNYFDQSKSCIDLMLPNSKFSCSFDENVFLEIGAGTAQFSLKMAKLFSEINFVAVDIKANRLAQGAVFAEQNEIDNVLFVRSEVLNLVNFCSPNSVNEIWITFPDPYPKKGDVSKRLFSMQYVILYKQLLDTRNGKIIVKTDDVELFNFGVETFKDQGASVVEYSKNLHGSDLPDYYKLTTRYEDKFLEKNLPIYCASFKF